MNTKKTDMKNSWFTLAIADAKDQHISLEAVEDYPTLARVMTAFPKWRSRKNFKDIKKCQWIAEHWIMKNGKCERIKLYRLPGKSEIK